MTKLPEEVTRRDPATPETFKGLIYVKHGRIGSRSEGPDYHLQTTRGDFLLRYQERNPWQPDYRLEFFNRRMVAVTGVMDDRIISVKAIEPILAPLLPREAPHVELAVGDSMTIDDVSFGLGAIEDSRCPIGTVCVWEGQVVAAMWASHGVSGPGAMAERFSLTLRPGQADLATKVVLGRRFTLLEVEPYPDPAIHIDPKQYVITLEIERA